VQADSQNRLDREIQLLRERLEGAEEMRRAVIAEELDGFVVGDGSGAQRVVLLETSTLATRPLLETLPHSAVTVSSTGHILYANQRFADGIGRLLARLFSTSMSQLLAPESRARFADWLATGVVDSSLDVVLLHQDGHRVACRATVIGMGNGHASLILADREDATADDAHEAVRAINKGEIDGVVVGGEEVMLLTHARNAYRALVDRMQQGAVTVSADGTVLYANARFADMVGRPRDAMLGLPLGAVLGTSVLDGALGQADRPVPAEITITHADGTALRVGVTAEPFEDTAGVTLVLSDLTERDRHVEMLERAQRNDRFLAVLAHELRNPLGAVRNAVEILRRSGTAHNGQRFALDVIQRQSETLVRLVDDLLDVQRLNEDKIVLRSQPVDLLDVIERAVAAARPGFDAKQQRVEVIGPPTPVYGNIDAVRFAQVLGNLLVNACKFTPIAGQVRVVLERGAAADGSEVASIRVIDTGIGVPPGLLDKLFEPYVQVAHEEQEFPEGLGLGLSVARRLVQLHGGSIDAHSAGLGQGTTLRVQLPTCATPVAPAPGRASQVPSLAGLRILIADDDEDNVSSLSHLLMLLGHQTRTARDGVEALAVAEAFQPQVAILDIGMPKMDGWKVGRALQARPWADGLVLYALTGWSQAQAVERTREAGFARHFAKPVAFEDLVRDLHARVSALR